MLKIPVFRCSVYCADISTQVCKKRREKNTIAKLQYLMDPYERCGTCQQALNVDNDDIEMFDLVCDVGDYQIIDNAGKTAPIVMSNLPPALKKKKQIHTPPSTSIKTVQRTVSKKRLRELEEERERRR